MDRRSVVENVPADGAPAFLIIEYEFTDGSRETLALPLPSVSLSLLSVRSWG
jgi:hypothetical protein